MKGNLSNCLLLLAICLVIFLSNGCAPMSGKSPTSESVMGDSEQLSPAIEPIPEPAVAPVSAEKKIEDQQPIADARTVNDLIVVGEIEPVTLVAPKLIMPARIDTGATTSSVDAQNINKFERDGKSWVKFSIKNRKTGKITELESQIIRIVKIKGHGGESKMRTVTKLKMKLGAVTLASEFSLTDRSSFEYPILIGRNVLDGSFIVDVSRKNVTSLMAEESKNAN